MPRIDQRQLGRIDFSKIDGVTKDALLKIIGVASQTTDGLMSAKDKQKLDNLNQIGETITISASQVIETPTRLFVNQAEKTALDHLNQTNLTYIHDQITPSKMWTINHNRGTFPSITVVDSGGNVVIGDVQYISYDQVVIKFANEFSGKAYIN